MELASNALTTLKTVQDHLTVADPAEASKLKWLINVASDRMENACNRKFGKAAYLAERYTGTGWRQLLAKNYPILEVSAITIDGVADTDYTINAEAGLLHREPFWPRGSALELSYTAGYVLPKDAKEATETEHAVVRTLPFDLEFACVMLVAQAYNQRGSEHLKAETTGPLKWEYLDEIPAVAAIQAKYRWCPL